MAPRLLIVDDDADGREALAEMACSWGWEPRGARDGQAALATALSWRPDAILSDLYMPASDGMWLLRALQAELPEIPVVLITGQASVSLAVESIQQGAYDFVEKPVSGARLQLVLDRAVERRAAHREVELLRGRLAASAEETELLGDAPATRALLELVRKVALSQASVVIQGPTGAGKEVVARAVHARSARRGGPFLAVNCAAIPGPLLEAELFGHERGAFTGAERRRTGSLEGERRHAAPRRDGGAAARRAGDAAPGAGERRCVSWVGPPRSTRSTCASSPPPTGTSTRCARRGASGGTSSSASTASRWRSRRCAARLDDVPRLARHFAARIAARSGRPAPELGADVVQRLREHTWPGNVRELRNAVERALILCDGRSIRPEHLPPGLGATGAREQIRIELGRPLDEVEREYLIATLRRLGGNRARTAQALGVSQKTLYNKLRRYALAGPA